VPNAVAGWKRFSITFSFAAESLGDYAFYLLGDHFNNTRFDELLALSADCSERFDVLIRRTAAARSRVAKAGQPPGLDPELIELDAEAEKIRGELAAIEEQLIALSGIPAEVFDQIEREQIRGDVVDRTPRRSVAVEAFEPTGSIDDLVALAVRRMVSLVDTNWLREQRRIGAGLPSSFLHEPLSLVRGLRLSSERPAAHRFAQTLLVAEDFVEGRPSFDWFAAASLLPQLAAFENAFDLLRHVGGNTHERIASLWQDKSEFVDSTVFELLVASACVWKGRSVSSLQVAPGIAKTPDFQIHGYPFPTFVECKRRQSILDADVHDDRHMRALFGRLREASIARGMFGIIDLTITVEAEALPVDAIVAAFAQQRLAIRPTAPTRYAWGQIAFHEARPRHTFDDTRLYSPYFLRTVFGWNTDLPSHDGIVCQVDPPDSIFVNSAKRPLALTWNSDGPQSIRRRSRSVAALFGQAVHQMPAGSVGIVYVAYNEGNREDVADERVRLAKERLKEWTHEWHIRVPIALVNRLIPRALGNGAPDLVETAIRVESSTYGSSAWFADFPSTVFTRGSGTFNGTDAGNLGRQ
jgi:hypothetical protein